MCFLNYACGNNPSFILEEIEPIECENIDEYKKYINTNDKRRIENFIGEYQYYYWIKSNHIKGILYNLYSYISSFPESKREIYIEEEY